MPGTLPTPSKAWNTTQVNIAVTTNTAGLTLGRPLVRAMKNALKAVTVPVTVKGSSNSVAAALDGVDRWSTDADLVWVQSSGAHSWIVYEFPNINDGAGHKLQMLWDLTGNGVSSAGIMQIYFSPAAGFTGGSTSARPTATDEVMSASNTFANAAAIHRVHLMASADGTIYHLILATANNPIGWLCVSMLTPTIDAVPTVGGWNYPFFVAWQAFSSANQMTATLLSLYNAAKFTSRHNATNLTCGIEVEGGSAIVKAGGAGNGPNGITSQQIMLGHGIWSNAGYIGRLGFLPDMYFVSDTAFAPFGDTAGADNSHRQWMISGCFALPWTNDATVPLGS